MKSSLVFAMLLLIGCGPDADVDGYAAWVGHQAWSLGAPMAIGSAAALAAAPLVSLGPSGEAVYGHYANHGAGSLVAHPPTNRVPDYSHAGYGGGGVALPDALDVARTLSSRCVHHVPLGVGDHGPAIQRAIEAVEDTCPVRAGFRGIVQLDPGTYDVGSTLRIRSSGVILRGAGQGLRGTTIHSTRNASSPQGNAFETTLYVKGDPVVRSPIGHPVAGGFVPVGADQLGVVASGPSAPFAVGDAIGIRRTPNALWEAELYPGAADPGWVVDADFFGDQWHERRVDAIEPPQPDSDVWTLVLDMPLVDPIYAAYGGAEIFGLTRDGRIENVGIEDLRLEANALHTSDESQDWDAIRIQDLRHGWVRRVTVAQYARSAVRLRGNARFNTIEEVAFVDPASTLQGRRRYAFSVTQNASGTLFQRCYAHAARHAFIASKRVPGPNVWLDSVAQGSENDDGPHARWVTGSLYDNISTRNLHVENRTTVNADHGWAGAQTMFWNSKAAQSLRCDTSIGAMNYAIGNRGPLQHGAWDPAADFGRIEGHGRKPAIRSLYLQQLADRLGPAAVDAVTVPEQRQGRIWHGLKAWGGRGRLDAALAAPSGP